MEVHVGVINPYALGEVMFGRKIDWNSLADPGAKLAEIMKVSTDDIFDVRNPILLPNFKVQADGTLATVAEGDALTNMKTFLKDRFDKLPHVGAGGVVPSVESVADIIHTTTMKIPATVNPCLIAGKEWIDMGDFFEDVLEYSDPNQGALGDCYFIAALASVAWARPYAIVNMIRPSARDNETNPIHKITFYKDGITAQTVEVDEKVPVTLNTHQWVYARSVDSGEIWPAVMEKAYAKWRTNSTGNCPPYAPIAGGDPVMACAQLIQGPRTYKANSSTTADQIYSFVQTNSLGYRTVNPMVAWTYCTPPANCNYSAAKVVACHAYSVLGYELRENVKRIVLRNPWGTHHAILDTRPGSWDANFMSFTARVPLDTNGVFSMKVDTFKKYFAGIGVAV